MSQLCFLSHSKIDGEQHTLRLAEDLRAAGFEVWIDVDNLKPDEDWDDQISEALKRCTVVLLVMTPDSVLSPNCKTEWSRGLRYKKSVVPLLLEFVEEPPLRLESRQHVDFTEDYDAGKQKLVTYLNDLNTPAGQLRTITARRRDAERDLGRYSDKPNMLARVKDNLQQIDAEIVRLKEIIANPEAVEKRTAEPIEASLERARQPEKPVGGNAGPGKFINQPPADVRENFFGRQDESRRIGDFLLESTVPLLSVSGRAGMGKTALVCRVLKHLEAGRLPDEDRACPVDGIVYLGALAQRRVDADNLLNDLRQLVPEESKGLLWDKAESANIPARLRAELLVQAFQLDRLTHGRVVVMLDNFEDLLDEANNIKQTELRDVLNVLVSNTGHGV